MTHDPLTSSATAAYSQDLIMALRQRDVPAPRIGELVAEVESHVADTGEDPVDAFGPAREYAAALVDEHRPGPWWYTTLTIICAALAGFLLAQGVVSVMRDEPYLGLPGWVSLAIGLVVVLPAARQLRKRSTAVRDPRTGASLAPAGWWSPLVLVAMPVAGALAGYGLFRVLG